MKSVELKNKGSLLTFLSKQTAVAPWSATLPNVSSVCPSTSSAVTCTCNDEVEVVSDNPSLITPVIVTPVLVKAKVQEALKDGGGGGGGGKRGRGWSSETSFHRGGGKKCDKICHGDGVKFCHFHLWTAPRMHLHIGHCIPADRSKPDVAASSEEHARTRDSPRCMPLPGNVQLFVYRYMYTCIAKQNF